MAVDAPGQEALTGVGPLAHHRGPRPSGHAHRRAKLHSPGERRRRGAQHDALGPLTVTLGEDLGDGPAHRVPDDHGPSHAELLLDTGNVVSAPLHAERRCPSPEAAMPTQVGGDDPEGTAEVLERPVPVERGRRHPPVEQDDDGCTRGPDISQAQVPAPVARGTTRPSGPEGATAPASSVVTVPAGA